MSGSSEQLLRPIAALWAGIILLFIAGCSDSDRINKTPQSTQPPTVKSIGAKVVDIPQPAKLDGSRQIRNRKYALLLRPRDANSADGAPIVLYSQQPWKCLSWRLDPTPQAGYRLVNYFTNKTFQPADSAAESTPVVQASVDDKQPRQTWQFFPLGNGFYKIVNAETRKALTATSDRAVIAAPWTETEEQEWELLDLPTLTM